MPRRILLVAAVLLAPTLALSGRALEEPDAVRSVQKRASNAQVKAALEARGLSERCPPAALRALELNGMLCRLAVFTHLSALKKLDSPKAIDERVGAAREAHRAAKAIATFEPLTKTPGLPKARYETHRLACQAVVEAYDALAGVPKTAPEGLRAKVDEAMQAFGEPDAPTLHEAACRCTQTSIELASRAGASLEEIGVLQGALTGRSCFLDQSKVKSERGGPEARFSGTAEKIAKQSTEEARLLAYARTRDLDFERCRAKGIEYAKVKDAKDLERCACGAMKRWRFPKERGRKDLSLLVPLVEDRLGVRVLVKANGKIAECGPLEGPMLE